MRSAAVLAACCCLLAVVLASCAPAAAAAGDTPVTVSYQPPVDAPLVDPFRPPPNRFAAGNRGVDFASAPGDAVRAAADGEVVFAGPVGASRHVVVLHADGLRTSYSFLASTAVQRGDRVQAGDVVGAAGGPLHWGVRAGDVYLDPLGLLAGGPPQVHLVPERERRPGSEADERRGLARFLRALPGRAARATAAAVRWARDQAGEGARFAAGYARAELEARLDEARGWLHYSTSLLEVSNPFPLVWTAFRAGQRWWDARGDCTPADRPPPQRTERHLLLEVAGLGSHTGGDADHPERAGAVSDLDTAALGYRGEDVLQFSYRGGTTDEQPYTAEDTFGDLTETSARLRALLGRLRVEHPGVPVDIVAHSQGGIVALLALGSGDAAGDPRLPQLGGVVMISTPFGGADLATLSAMVGHTGPGAVLEAALGRFDPGGIDPTAPAVGQLAETSHLTRSMDLRPLPTGVRLTSIAGAHDWVVPSAHAHLAGATNVVIRGGGLLRQHGSLPGSPEAQREVALALAGAPPTCQSLLDTVGAAVESRLIEHGWDTLGAGATALGHWVDRGMGPTVPVKLEAAR